MRKIIAAAVLAASLAAAGCTYNRDITCVVVTDRQSTYIPVVDGRCEPAR